MTAPSPAISKVRLSVNVEQSGPDELVLSSRTLGMDPYVVVEMRLDDGVLSLDVEVGGEEMSMSAIGHALELLADAMTNRGDALTAQVKDTGESAVLNVKRSQL